MKIELTRSEISNLAANEIFLAKKWLKDYLWYKTRGEGNSLACQHARSFMLESFKLWRKLRSNYGL